MRELKMYYGRGLYRLLLIVMISVFALLPGQTMAVESQSEQIDTFRSGISINQDGSISVKETITYNFGAQNKHGIYRYIPYKYQNRSTKVTNVTVTDENGQRYNFGTTIENGNKVLKIGDANSYVTGVKTYVINYKVTDVINFVNNQDELYLNVTGNGWDVPIAKTFASVTLPKAFSKDQIKLACYAGLTGSKTICSGQGTDGSVADFAQAELSNTQGLTVVVGFPQSTAAAENRKVEPLKLLWPIIIPILTLFGMIALWYYIGRDPKGKGTIVPQYDPPSDLSPLEVAVLNQNGELTKKAIASQIIYLAQQGYITIERIPKKGIFGKEDYKFIAQKKKMTLDSTLSFDLYRTLLDGKESKLMSAITDFNLSNLKSLANESLKTKGYAVGNMDKVRTTYFAIAGVIGVAGVFAGFKLENFILGASIFVAAAIISIFGFVMMRRTQKGAEMNEYVRGLKLYMEVAEKDRMNFASAPEKDPKKFEELLPYAIALGVEKKWAEKFKDLALEKPTWYNDSSMTSFNSAIFVGSLGRFESSTNNYVAATTAAAAGGSGFGGGGFSGGGFGGGGGGSW